MLEMQLILFSLRAISILGSEVLCGEIVIFQTVYWINTIMKLPLHGYLKKVSIISLWTVPCKYLIIVIMQPILKLT